MNIVIPMAGRGRRFVEAGYETPKPLIPVRGRPMYAWAVDSLPLGRASGLIFLCLAEHLEDGSLERDIRARYGAHGPMILPVETVTEGQACTVLLARAHIDSDAPLLIFNADTHCRTGLATSLPGIEREADGVLGVFEAEGDHWSFARTDPRGRVVETSERRRISRWASTGLYHFSRGRDFVAHAEAMIEDDERVRGEFYIAPVYNRLIAQGADLRIDVAEEVWVLGTPEQLARFEAQYPSTRSGSAPG